MRSNSYRTSIVGTPVGWSAPWFRTPTPIPTSVGYTRQSPPTNPFSASKLTDNFSNDCNINWNEALSRKLVPSENFHEILLIDLQVIILGEVSHNCPNVTPDKLSLISREISCTLLRYDMVNRTLVIQQIIENAADDIKNVLEERKIYNLSPIYSDKCLSFKYNFDLSTFNNEHNDSEKYFSIDQTKLYTNISHSLMKANETISSGNLSSYVLENILKILNNIPDNVRENISNITSETMKKYVFNSEWKKTSCAIEISHKIVELILKARIPIDFISSSLSSQSEIETSIQTSVVHQLYTNLFEFLENHTLNFDLPSILLIQQIIRNTLQNKIPKLKTSHSVKSKIFHAISYVLNKHSGNSNSRQNAINALMMTVYVVNITKSITNYQKTTINDIREFKLVKLKSYEIINLTNFISNFIAVTHEMFFEKYEKKISKIIHDILTEYKNSTNIEKNFNIILDRLYNASDEALNDIYILGNLELYLNQSLTEHTTSSLQLSRLIMKENIMSKLSDDFQEIQILQLQNIIFHILLEHNYDCNGNYSKTNLIDDIVTITKSMLNVKQNLGIENFDAIITMNINFTAIEQNLTSTLIKIVKQNRNTNTVSAINRITLDLLNSVTFEKFICHNTENPTLGLFQQYLSNVIKKEVQQFFSIEEKINIFNLENIIIKLLLLEYSKCIYEKGYNLAFQSNIEHTKADWHCLDK